MDDDGALHFSLKINADNITNLILFFLKFLTKVDDDDDDDEDEDDDDDDVQ